MIDDRGIKYHSIDWDRPDMGLIWFTSPLDFCIDLYVPALPEFTVSEVACL